MNKQEVIERLNNKLDETFAFQQSFKPLTWTHMECESKANAYMTAINYVEQLDEPQKVTVPECVAEYIEAHRKWGPEIFIGDWLADNDAVYKWLYNNSEKENNRRFLIAVKAFVEGYEVEKEPLYTVTINLDLKYHLAVDEGDDDEISTTLTTSHDVLGYRYFLTEKEIKSADENLWPFAEPVEQVEV